MTTYPPDHSPDAERDKQLLRLLQQGDEAAFTGIYDLYWKPLFTVAANKLSSLSEAEELVQDIFLDLWHRRETLSITSSFSAYLSVAVRYKVIDRLARRARQQRYQTYAIHHAPLLDNSTEETIRLQELERRMQDAVAALPEKCRLVFALSREQGFSQKEIALRLGIAVKTVEAHLTKAIRILRMTLGSLFVLLQLLFR